MPQASLTREQAQSAVDAVSEHGTPVAAARAIGLPRSTLRSRLETAKREFKLEPTPQHVKIESMFTVTAHGDTTTVYSVDEAICTADQALAKAGIDLSLFSIKEATVNQTQCPMKLHAGHDQEGYRKPDKPVVKTLWQVKVTVQRRQPKPITDGLDLIYERFKQAAPKCKLPPRKCKPKSDLLYMLALYDAHFGKLCWAQETENNYDLKIAESVYENAAGDLLAHVDGLSIKRFLIPIGQDFLHIDNLRSETTRGTPQDVDGRYPKVFDVAFGALVGLVERIGVLAPGADVDLIYSASNHDLLAAWHLAHSVMQYFRHSKRVNVCIQFRKHKFYRWGTCLLGLTHGDNLPRKWDTLPNLMATLAKKDWAETTHHEWLTGHVHHKSKVETLPFREVQGCIMRTLSSLSGTDAYHYENGYISGRSAEGYLYSQSAGYVGHFNANARET